MIDNEDFVKEPPVKDLIEEFKYKIKPTETHRRLLKVIEEYYKHNEKFMTKHNYEAGKRARKSLLEIGHLIKKRRAEISGYIYRGDEDDQQSSNN